MPRPVKDMAGLAFGALTVIGRDPGKVATSGHVMWICKCDCGRLCSVSQNKLQAGARASCGHIYRAKAGRPAKTMPVFGVELTASEVARIAGVSFVCAWQRFNRGATDSKLVAGAHVAPRAPKRRAA